MKLTYDFAKLKKKDLRLYKLARAHEEIEHVNENSDIFGYDVLEKDGGVPSAYRLNFRVKSFVGINADSTPIYGNYHTAEMKLPASYPREMPSLYFVQNSESPDIPWHPNIMHHSPKTRGHVCLNKAELGFWHTMDHFIMRIYDYLVYRNYLADNVSPYPEDGKVAIWVKNHGEPMGLVDKEKGMVLDTRPLMKPSQEWVDSRKPKPSAGLKIKINKRGAAPAPPADEGNAQEAPQQEAPRKKITIIKR